LSIPVGSRGSAVCVILPDAEKRFRVASKNIAWEEIQHGDVLGKLL